jgi:gluconate 2-dehydrogenase gamma chain
MFLRRRTFLQAITTLIGARARAAQTAAGRKIFSTHQARTVDAIAEQIIPKDDQPGAAEAGVLYYIDRALAGDLRRHRGRYNEGLLLVDRTSRAQHGKDFIDLPGESQTAILRALESGGGLGAEFFQLIRLHTMEGFYGDPRYGGNKNSVSWKMLGFRS